MSDETPDKASDAKTADDSATLNLPPRTNRPPPVPETQPGDHTVETLVCGTVSLLAGYVVYLWLASRELDLFMFDIGRVDSILGSWSGVVGYVYAAACAIVTVAAIRRLITYGMKPGAAAPLSVFIGLAVSVAVTMALVALAAVALMFLGLFGLFFHSGDR